MPKIEDTIKIHIHSVRFLLSRSGCLEFHCNSYFLGNKLVAFEMGEEKKNSYKLFPKRTITRSDSLLLLQLNMSSQQTLLTTM